MATKVLADIRAAVRFRGDFRNPQRFPDASIDIEIQAAFAEGYELVADVNEGYFDTQGNVSTAASTAFVALPTGTWRIRGVDRLDGSDFVEMRAVGVADRNRYGSTTGTPEAYRPTARGLDLYPTPDAIYTLRVTYTPVAPAIGATPIDFYNGWEEFTIYGALIRISLNEERDTREWQQQLELQRQRITRGASQRRSQEPELLVLRDGYGSDMDPHPWWSW